MKAIKIIIALVIIGGLLWAMVAQLKGNREKLQQKTETVNIDAVAVKVSSIGQENLSDKLKVVGTIFSPNDVTVYSQTQGIVKQLFVDKGSYLNRGGAMAQVDDELLKLALQTSEANLDKAKRDLQRFEALLNQKAGTDVAVEGARIAVKNLEAEVSKNKRLLADTRIVSPIDGIVTERMINMGTMVAPGAPVANVVDMNQLKARLLVPEEHVFQLKVGDEVQLMTDVYPGLTFPGRISYISPKGDPTHSFPVEVAILNNTGKPLKTGMYIKATFMTTTQVISMVLPRKALIGSSKDAKVFIVEGDKAVTRPIVVGQVLGDKMEILSGLTGSEQVVVDGQVNLREETKVKIIP
jgi:membrane fusion protein, multidrug efflux system